MDRLYTARQVRGLDHAAIHTFGIPGYRMMQRAGRAVTDETLRRFPAARSWLLLCGPGNNGGDGYVVARLAADAGIEVTLCSLVEPATLTGDAARAAADWQAAGGEVLAWPLAGDHPCDVALDALLGTGITREVEGDFAAAIAWLNSLDCPRVAIDIPSGLSADTGRVLGCAVQAQVTVTFVGRKRGMYTADGPDHCGDLVFDDLAIPPEAREASPEARAATGVLLRAEQLAELFPPRRRNTHKGNYGHVLAVGGAAGMSGAIRLCGEAALRSGAGKVTLATAAAHAPLINLTRPELMVKAIETADDLQSLPLHEYVIAVGPGIGRSAWAKALFQQCLEAGAPLVIDADGLNLLAAQPPQPAATRADWILTPHPAEAGRLAGCSAADIQRDRVGAAQAIAGRFNACVVLKGCGSVIAAPDGAYAICAHGNPGMATAGSGDVLTGVIAALLGQRLSGFQSALAGTLAHALAGDLAARQQGEVALLANDITQQLPAVWKSAGTSRSRS